LRPSEAQSIRPKGPAPRGDLIARPEPGDGTGIQVVAVGIEMSGRRVLEREALGSEVAEPEAYLAGQEDDQEEGEISNDPGRLLLQKPDGAEYNDALQGQDKHEGNPADE